MHTKNSHNVLEKFQSYPEIDLVLVDINLPDINGLEFAKQMKLKREEVSIVAQTAHASNEERNKCIRSVCIDFISKPIVQVKLYAVLS